MGMLDPVRICCSPHNLIPPYGIPGIDIYMIISSQWATNNRIHKGKGLAAYQVCGGFLCHRIDLGNQVLNIHSTF